MIKLEAGWMWQLLMLQYFIPGFLVGGDYFDYRLVTTRIHRKVMNCINWRTDFFDVCRSFNVKPAAACIQFGLHAPGVKSIALSTTEVKRIKDNIQFANTEIPSSFWETLKAKGLISVNFFEKKPAIPVEGKS